MNHFQPSSLPDEGSGCLYLFQLVDRAVPDYFAPDKRITVARAPGRIDVMGGIAEYSGSLVLQFPTSEAACVAVQDRDDELVCVWSPTRDETRSQIVKWGMRDLGLRDQRTDLAVAGMLLRADPRDRWTCYVLGALLMLTEARGLRIERGVAILLRSDVPEGKGIGASSAITVATLRALAEHYGIELTGQELALLCERVEREIARAECSVADAMTAVFGKSDELTALRCQPCGHEGSIALPEDMEIVGIDSGLSHATTDSTYLDVRAAAAMGARMLLDVRGIKVHDSGNGRWGEDDPWRGYLANCAADDFRDRFDSALPASMLGAEFAQRFGGHADVHAPIDAQRRYPVRAATRHPIEENARAERFRAILQHGGGVADNDRIDLGELMFASHRSYTACGLGHARTDYILEQARIRREKGGMLYGARVTGRGAGGAVALLGKRVHVWHEALRIKKALLEATGHSATIFRYSSQGSLPFGVIQLAPKS